MATAREHITMAERLLSDASFISERGIRVNRHGEPLAPGEREAAIAAAQVHAVLANAQLQVERLDRAAATEQLLADVKPSPRSLDPRANRKAYDRRNKKSPPVASGEDS